MKRKAFLIFLLIACILATIYAGYLLFTHRTEPTIGIVIFVVDIGVLIWNISVLRKLKVGTGTVVAIVVVIALLGATIGAFAGIKPFSTAKSEVVTWFQEAPSQLPSSPSAPPASEYVAPAPTNGDTNPSEQPEPKKVIVKNLESTWGISIISAKLTRNDCTDRYVDTSYIDIVTIKLSVKNIGSAPAYFLCNFSVVDNYGINYSPETYCHSGESFLIDRIYPQEVREGTLTFLVNKHAENLTLAASCHYETRELLPIPSYKK